MGRLGYQSNAQAALAVSYNCLESYAASLHEAMVRPYPAYYPPVPVVVPAPRAVGPPAPELLPVPPDPQPATSDTEQPQPAAGKPRPSTDILKREG